MHGWGDSVKRLIALLVLGLFMSACEEEASGPSTSDFKRNRAEVAKRAAAAKAKDKKSKPKRVATAESVESTESSFGALDRAFAYDRRGKRDPFRSFEWDRLAAEANADAVRGPLERFSVSQLHLVAIIWSTGRPRALLEDPAGDTYVVGPGTRIGKNAGFVVEIDDNSLIVKETYVDLVGQETTKDLEMVIHRNLGG